MCRKPVTPIASASFIARPQKNSIWLSMRAAVWLADITGAPPTSFATSRLPGPPSITTRSQGTSTSSNTAMQSISSKRLLSGWSKRLCGPGATGSRQISLSPGWSVGMANDTA